MSMGQDAHQIAAERNSRFKRQKEFIANTAANSGSKIIENMNIEDFENQMDKIVEEVDHKVHNMQAQSSSRKGLQELIKNSARIVLGTKKQ